MKHTQNLEVEIDKDEAVDGFRKAVQFHLTENEQLELINELLKVLPEPTEIVEKYASYFSSRKAQGGHVNASPRECWLMAKKDYNREVEKKAKRIFTGAKK